MPPTAPPVCDFGFAAPDFALPGTDGRNWTFDEIAGPKGTLIMFICNHCPYVLGILDRLVRDVSDIQAMGVGVAAISSNDAVAYPADSFDKMGLLARNNAFPFPYLYDETQKIAEAYGAACTPDFFGFNSDRALQYRGRLDASGKSSRPPEQKRDLVDAMKQIAETGAGPEAQVPSIGCSIKWSAS